MAERDLEVRENRLTRKTRDAFMSLDSFSEWLRDRGYPDPDLLAEIVPQPDPPGGARRRPTAVPKPTPKDGR